MKISKTIAIAAIFTLVATITSCKGANTTKDNANTADTTAVADSVEAETYLTAIDRYLVDSIGKFFDKADASIPNIQIIAVDEQNPEDILAWGSYWLENYNIVGDTLKTASGGNYPGLMHIRNTDGHFVVTSFDIVEDGSNFKSSAERIFGDKYAEFSRVNSNDVARDSARMVAIRKYVDSHGLKVNLVQDYGWPAKEIK